MNKKVERNYLEINSVSELNESEINSQNFKINDWKIKPNLKLFLIFKNHINTNDGFWPHFHHYFRAKKRQIF